MIPYLGCHAAREMLQASIDGELPVADQVTLESHLRWCDVCRARIEDFRLIGAAIRMGCATSADQQPSTDAFGALRAALLARVGAERQHAFGAQWRTWFSDMRFLWPALGATVAVLVCLSAVASVNAFVRAHRPDSMAAEIALLANPGSDQNPLDFESGMLAPRSVDAWPALYSIPEGDEMVAIAAVVTREGRVAHSELLAARDAAGLQGRMQVDAESALLDAVRYSRFEPARTRNGAVAVNVVWLLTRTTVTAPADVSDERVLPVLPALRPARS